MPHGADEFILPAAHGAPRPGPLRATPQRTLPTMEAVRFTSVAQTLPLPSLSNLAGDLSMNHTAGLHARAGAPVHMTEQDCSQDTIVLLSISLPPPAPPPPPPPATTAYQTATPQPVHPVTPRQQGSAQVGANSYSHGRK